MNEILPYPGLRAFQREESKFFFGREEHTDELIKRLGRHRFIAVVGPSGCGKSSLVRAGMIPALEAGFMGGVGARWRFAIMRPGRRPLLHLAETFLEETVLGNEKQPTPDKIGQIYAFLKRGEYGVVELFEQRPLPESTNLLLVVDQFEEIFRFRMDANEDERGDADAFVNLLLETARQVDLRVFVVITMRSDYLGSCGRYPALADAINKSQYLTPRLTRHECEKAIVGPARMRGSDVEPALVTRLLNDVNRLIYKLETDQDHLPLLQHVLMRMWTEKFTAKAGIQKGRRDVKDGPLMIDHASLPALTLNDYEQAGFLDRALSLHANEAYDSLNGEGIKKLVGAVFRCLTAIGPEKRDIRRPTSLGKIVEITKSTKEQVVSILEAFRKPDCNFIMPSNEIELTDDRQIDISHECLIRQWDRMIEWVELEQNSEEKYRNLLHQARIWAEKSKHVDYLLKPSYLEIILEWQKKDNPSRAWTERYGNEYDLTKEFIEQSEKDRQEKELAKIKEQQRNLEELERQAEEDRRRAQEQSGLRKIADEQRLRALKESETAEKERQRAEEQKRLAEVSEIAAVEERKKAVKARRIAVIGCCFAIAIACYAGVMYWIAEKAKDQAEVARVLADEAREEADSLAKFTSLQSSRILASIASKLLEKSDKRSLELGALVARMSLLFARRTDDWSSMKKSSDLLKKAVATHPDMTKNLLRDPSECKNKSYDTIALNRAGKSLAASRGQVIDIIERTSVGCRQTHTLEGHENTILTLAFSPKGDLLASGGVDNTVIIWNLREENKPYQKLSGHTDRITSVTFDKSGSRLASGSADRTLLLWDIKTGKYEKAPVETTKAISHLQFHPHKKVLAFGCVNGAVFRWDFEKNTIEPHQFKEIQMSVKSLAFSTDNGLELLASGHEDNKIALWNLKKPSDPKILEVKDILIYPLFIKKRTLYSGSHLWQLEALNDENWKNRQVKAEFTADTILGDGTVSSAVLSGDGKVLVALPADDSPIQWHTCHSAIFEGVCSMVEDFKRAEIRNLGLSPFFMTEEDKDNMTEKFTPDSCSEQDTDAQSKINFVQSLLDKGRIDEAQKKVLEYKKTHPEIEAELDLLLENTYLLVAKKKVEKGEIDSALRYFGMAKELNPSRRLFIEKAQKSTANYLRGQAKTPASEGNVEKVKTLFKQANKLYFTSKKEKDNEARIEAKTNVQAGLNLAMEGKIKEAVTAFENAQIIDSKLKIAASQWNQLCLSGNLLKQYDEVKPACRKAHQLDKTQLFYKLNWDISRAATAEKKEDLKNAISDLKEDRTWIQDAEFKEQVERWIKSLNDFAKDLKGESIDKKQQDKIRDIFNLKKS